MGWLAALGSVLAGLFAVVTLFAFFSMLGAADKPFGAPVAGIFAVLFAGMAWFLASAGKRLRSGRFNDHGSLASPAAWLACCVGFLAMALLFAVMAVVQRDLTPAIGAASGGLLALLAYGAWSHFRGIRVRGRQAPPP